MKSYILYFLTLTLINASLIANASDVVVTAKNEGYTAFHDAVMSAGIYEHAKKNEGEAGSLAPFTVFVPTNEAFEAIKSLDAKKLKKYITYHVVPGKKLEKLDDTMKDGVGTVGEKLLFSQNDELFLDESKTKAKVTKGPITASNGLIYVIDHVLLPAGEELSTTEKPVEKKVETPVTTAAPAPTPSAPPAPAPVVTPTPVATAQPIAPAVQSTPPIQLMMPVQMPQQEPITEKTAQTLASTMTQLTQSIQLLIHVIQQAQNPLETPAEKTTAATSTTAAAKPPVVVA